MLGQEPQRRPPHEVLAMPRYHHFQNSFAQYTDLIKSVDSWQQRYQLSTTLIPLAPGTRSIDRYRLGVRSLQRAGQM